METYISLLKKEFLRRQAKNPRYTLRSYARYLGLDSGSLSAILKGKRPLPRNHWKTCCEKLNLEGEKKEVFYRSLSQHFSLPEYNLLESAKRNLTLVRDSQYKILTDWEYAAVLCLMNCPDFFLSPIAIKNSLNCNNQKAEEIFNNLASSQLVSFDGKKWIASFENFVTTEDTRSEALQESHLNELQLAGKKLKELNILEREFSSLTFVGKTNDLPKMKTWLRQMRREFDRRFENPKGDAVFIFSHQLYPVAKRVQK